MQHRLVRWLPAVIAPVVVAGAVAVPLVASATPPDLAPKSAQQVLELVAKAKDVTGFTGTVSQTSDLGLPAVPSVGAGSDSSTASALDLITGTHTARVEVAGASKERIAVLDPSAERDVIRDGRSVWVWNSKTNSATHVTATGTVQPETAAPTTTTPSALAEELLAKVDGTTTVAVDTAQTVAGHDAYTLVLTPKTSATTSSVRIAVDATTGLPLDVQVIPRGASSPAIETGFTDLTYAVPAASRFAFTPPKDAKVTTRTLKPGAKPEARTATPGAKPTVSGSDWSSVVTVPASAVPSDLATNPTVTRLTTAEAGGRVLHTALVNVLLTDDGRVLAGAVPVSTLESAAGVSTGLAIETDGLGKRFRGRDAVADLALAVPEGSVFGFLGPNGSGKTTTIRMLLGLVNPTAGRATLLGGAMPGRAAAVLPRVGALVEGPGFAGYLSGAGNLARLDSADPLADPRTRKARIDAALERVGLSAAAGKRAKAYSLGMKQRLGIANALLRPRELLVLDEPTNGLDPQGTREVRTLVRELAGEGTTVFVSSHLLTEIEQMCTHAAVMRAGRLVAQGTLDELRGAAIDDRLHLLTPDVEPAIAALSAAGLAASVSGPEVVAPLAGRSVEELVPVLVAAGVRIRGVRTAETSLEDRFVALTGEGFDVES